MKNFNWMFIGWLTLFLVGTDLFIVSPFLPLIGNDLGEAPARMAILVSIFGITYAIFSPIIGKMSERLGRKKILLFGLICIGIANILTGLSTSILVILLSRFFAGLGAASITPMIYALTAEISIPQKRAGSLALVGSGLVIALALGSPLGFIIGVNFAWRSVFILLGILFIISCPINYIVWKIQKNTIFFPNEIRKTDENILSSFILFIVMILWASSIYSSYTMYGIWLADEFNNNYLTAIILSLFGFGAFIGMIFGGKLADKYGEINIIKISFFITAIIYFIFWIFYKEMNFTGISLLLFFLSLFSYGIFPSIQSYASHKFKDKRSTVLGLLSSCLYVGITLGSFIAGNIYFSSGMGGVIIFSLLLSVSGILFANFIK